VIVRALFDRAEGYSHEVSRTTLYRGKEQTVTNTVSYPPDTQARMFWLRNRQRHYWRARAEAAPEWEPGPEAVDPLVAALDAAAESVRHAAERGS
jgi:hypothetical protein